MGGNFERMTYEDMLHLIAYMRRMMEQMSSFLDEAEKKIPKDIECKKDFKRDNTGSWP